jgi:hypothetical protein
VLRFKDRVQRVRPAADLDDLDVIDNLEPEKGNPKAYDAVVPGA